MTFAALTVPTLDGVAASYTIDAGYSFARELTLALLDGQVITNDDLVKRPKSELELATRALSRRWASITQGMHYFDWNLRIESAHASDYSWLGGDDATVWASIQTRGGPVSCHQLYIRDAILELERIRKGLGQTVLATLYDALRMLPVSITPGYALRLAEYIYWCGEKDENACIDEMMDMHDVTTIEDLFEVADIFRRADFFGDMPEWVAQPKRVLTRNQVRRAANRDDYAGRIVEAMDAVWNVVHYYGPFADLRFEDVGADLIDVALLLRWDDSDQIGRVVDDFLHQICEGEHVISSALMPLKIPGNDFGVWLKEMEATALLAKAVERVLHLFEERDGALSRIMVRV